jgi:predicted alpha/beta hydrolase family esterase
MRLALSIPAKAPLYVLVTATLFLAGCAGMSQFIPAPPPGTPEQSIAYPEPDKKILLIYNHGSTQEFRRDQCRPNGSTTPLVVKELSGKKVLGLDVVVYGFCTPAKTGSYQQGSRAGEPKIMRRVENIEEVVRSFQNSGVPTEHIFLVGHSAGGWASLMVARRHNVRINAVIAFAPAFAGRKSGRSPGWQALHDNHVRFMAEAREMNALVYAFDSDAFNSPEDLAFLGDIPGTRLVRLGAQEIDGSECDSPDGHQTVFRDCFARTQERVILAYLAERLTGIRKE